MCVCVGGHPVACVFSPENEGLDQSLQDALRHPVSLGVQTYTRPECVPTSYSGVSVQSEEVGEGGDGPAQGEGDGQDALGEGRQGTRADSVCGPDGAFDVCTGGWGRQQGAPGGILSLTYLGPCNCSLPSLGDYKWGCAASRPL